MRLTAREAQAIMHLAALQQIIRAAASVGDGQVDQMIAAARKLVTDE